MSCAPRTQIPSAGTPAQGAGSNLHHTKPANVFSALVPLSLLGQEPLNLPCGPSSIRRGAKCPQPWAPSIPKLGNAEGKGRSWGGKAAQSRGLWSTDRAAHCSRHPCSLLWSDPRQGCAKAAGTTGCPQGAALGKGNWQPWQSPRNRAGGMVRVVDTAQPLSP